MRLKKATVITYGCQMNVNESAKMKNILEELGYEMTENIKESDAIFLNTCTVREGAATQIYGKLGELKQVKEERGSIIGVTGCFAQEQGMELIKKFPIIDIVMGNQNIGRLPQAIENIENQSEKHMVFTDHEDDLPPRLDADFGNDQSASIAISYGCNNFCTYCIVPYVRGRERSVPLQEIVKDVEQYVKKGAKEIMLLGQNVNSYGHDFDNGDTFARLLTEICKVEGDFIVRFVSPHPRDFTDDVIDVIAKEEKIAKSLHLPLQAGSTHTLKRMNRGYSKEEYLTLAKKIQERIPGVALTTDIIVGFPGETEEDFLDTLEVVREVNYDNAFMFMYSIRKGTMAANMQDQIPEETKKERLKRLMDLQARCSLKESQKYQGKRVRVLVEGESKKKKEVLTGRTSTNKVVLFEGDISLKGQFVDLEIYDCKTWTLYGKLV